MKDDDCALDVSLLVENVVESQLAVAASRVEVSRNHLEMVDDSRQLPSFGTEIDD